MKVFPEGVTCVPEPGAERHSVAMLDQLPVNSASLLGLVWFGEPGVRPMPSADLPCLHVPLPLLEQAGHPGEAWLGSQPRNGEYQGISYRTDGDLLFGVLAVDEDRPHGTASGLQRASETAYTRIFELLQQAGHPHLFRTWNYIARINAIEPAGDADLERYRQFNIGRQAAFDRHRHCVASSAPAACALGSRDGPLRIAFVAGTTVPQLIENPRQVSAYHYPSEYGPRSPTFSRAALVRTGDQCILLISGTASIVGHRSMHLGDVVAQTREALNNIAALIGQARDLPDTPSGIGFTDLYYRVYLRHPETQAQVKQEIERYIGSECDCSYVQADVCRQELLVEIEATGSWPLTVPAPNGGHRE